MQTVLWGVSLFLCFCSEMITLYSYLVHDDLKRGAITPPEVTQKIGIFHILETLFQTLVSLALIFNGNYILFLASLPLLFLNYKIYLRNEFSYSLFDNDHVKRNELIISIKLYAYYIFLMLACLFNFMNAFSSMMLYRYFS